MFEFSTIEQALEDLRQGKIILCTDDPTEKTKEIYLCGGIATTENVNLWRYMERDLLHANEHRIVP